MKIFLSAVTGELGRYREELHRALLRKKLEPRIQENFRPGTATLLEMLRDYIGECDRVILLIGEHCGAFPAENEVKVIGSIPEFDRYRAHAGQSHASYTQWEFFLARHFGKPIQVFITGQDFVPPAPNSEAADLRSCQQACRDWIKHLGLARWPLSTTEKLIEDVLVDDLVTHSGPRPNNLPYHSLGELFKGRDSFLTELKASLARTADRKATAVVQSHAVHGLGGVGKTRLAVEYAWQQATDYTALLFVTADSPENLRRSLAALVGPLVLNLPEQDLPQEEVRMAAALRWLETHPGWFLILDNVDTADAAAAAEDILARLRHGHVLITSRLAQWSAGVEPLELDVLTPDSAMEFLLARTENRRRKTATDATAAATLARDLDGLALALEQAAAYIAEQRCSLAEYLVQWRAHDRTVQEWFNARAMKYPRSVAATWETTLVQLGAGEVALLRLFAWFAPEPIPLFVLEGEKAAEQWCQAAALLAKVRGTSMLATGTPREALVKLVNYSMAKFGEGEEVLIHRVVQEILRKRTPDSSRKEWITSALRLLNAAAPADPDDVRTWPRWNPLRPHVESAVEAAEPEKISEPTTRLLACLGALMNAKALYREAEPLMCRALAIDEKSLGPEHSDVATDLNNLAQLLKATNRLAEAEPLKRRALAIDEQSFGPEHSKVATDLNNLALLLQATNRLAEAERLMRRALAINEQSLGPEHPRVATDLNNLALLLKDTNRLAEAEPLMRRALAIDEESLGPEHSDVATDLNNLAQLLKATNRLAEAEPLMRQALNIDEQSLGTEHPNVARDLNNLALLLQATNRLAQAEPLMRRALAIDEQSFGPEHPDVAIELNNLAQLLQTTNRLAEGEPLMRRALMIFVRSFGAEHPKSQTVAKNYGLLLQAQGLSSQGATRAAQEVIAVSGKKDSS